MDVIGSRGKNWPITDGKDQARLIASTLAGTKFDAPVTRGRDTDDGAAALRSTSPSKKHIQDPHASLALFSEQGNEENARKPQPAMIAPRASAKPADHEHSELFAAGHEDYDPEAVGSSSPKKAYTQQVVAPKGGGGSSYKPSRLFDQDATEDLPARYKSNPAKYDHFDIGEVSEHDHFQSVNPATSTSVPMKAKSNKHLSQWDFEDFTTPEKTRNHVRGQDVRHFGWSDDEGENVETPGKEPMVARPRRDAEAHFELKDDGTPKPGQHRAGGRQKGTAHNSGLGLYQNNLYDDGMQGAKFGNEKEPLSAVTTNVGRTKDFDNHWTMSDASPASGDKINNENQPLAGDRKNALQSKDPAWTSYDQTPEQNKRGVGSKPLRKGMESHWGFGVDEREQTTSGKKVEKSYWDF